MAKKIIIGCDHAGFSLKKLIVRSLEKRGYEVVDSGCFSEESVDYPRIAFEVSEKVAEGEFSKGILICGTGIGMSMAANRFQKIRAALCGDHLSARLSREHNDSNILVMGSRVIGTETAKDILDVWLNTEFAGERHLKRVEMLDDIAEAGPTASR